ncbi:MAG: histone deacetylase family protein [Paraburkholderia sp.]|uniref:histone deacetylase family protein n=1 Tax=Paraburkholderia sp. TaxID=1926495 RepID=UPI003C56DC51
MLTFFHPEQLKHHPRSYLSRGKLRTPQEVPERAVRLVEAAKSLGFDVREPADFGMAPLAAVHGMNYLRFLEEAHAEWKKMPEDWGDEVMSNIYVREGNPLRGVLGKAARYLADGSCPIGPDTWRSAYWSAQSAVASALAINEGEREAYALCRPPGHHARAEGAGGFCYLNNAAVAAQVLRERFGRVAILDTDMHHGQGVQEIFYGRDDVLYVSIHGDPTNFYPVVAGYEDEHGAGAGDGYNVNLPMPHGSGEEVFFENLNSALRSVQRFKPDALVLALGFDIYKEDPQAMVAVTTEGFGRLGGAIGALKLPTVIVQEGGYHIDSLEANAQSFFTGFDSPAADF